MDALVAGATQKLEALEAALYGLKQVRGRFTSEDELITAEVNSEGALVALTLAEAATSVPPAELAEAIVTACRQAAESAGQQRSSVIATLNESFVPGPDSARD
ncbi:YbaB/EbfC family nucleoid-associated protein [Nocardia thailandica]|uniref:YbaB/EbfC family nucleoid-associated protein n=2 Tax=Nocardia thailandica TaxID=257275 RepID=A0ABW6PJZ4_9NOCA